MNRTNFLPLALLAFTLAVSSARATLLLYDGFATAADEQNRSAYATSQTKLGNANSGTAWTTGLVDTGSYKWSDTSGVVYSFPDNYGLSLPALFADGNGVQFTARGGSAGYLSSGSAQEKRAKNRAISATMPTTGTLFYRCLMKIEPAAHTALKTGNEWRYQGTGLSTISADNVYNNQDDLKNNGFRIGFTGRKSPARVDIGANIGGQYKTVLENVAADTTYIFLIGIDYDTGKAKVYAASIADYAYPINWTMENIDLADAVKNAPMKVMFLDGDYQTNSGRALFDEIAAGTTLEDVAVIAPATAPQLGDVSLSRTGSATYSVMAEEATNAADLYWIADNGTSTPVTNLIQSAVSAGSTATGTISGIAANKTYTISVLAKNANGEDVKEAGVIYTGELTLGTTTDANEYGLVPGTVAVSRTSADSFPLTVNYTISGSVGTEGTTWEAPVAVTIPANSATGSLVVTPRVDSTVTQDITVTVALAAGNYEIPSSNSATLQIINVAAPSGYNTWMAPADGLASVGSNWSEGHAPTASENVLIDGYFSTANCEWDADASATVGSWTQNASYTSTVTFDTVYAGKGDFTVFTVTGNAEVNGGVWTHPLSLTSTAKKENDAVQSDETYRLNVAVGGTFTLGAGGMINVTGKGERQTAGSSPMPRHGGALDYTSFCYGNPKYPVDIGSAGWSGTDQDAKKAAGGGAVHLTVTGAVVVNGRILADGESKPYACGAGGSILIEAPSVSGTGMIRAGYTYAKSNSSGIRTGAGGRVALLTTDAVDLSSLWVSAAAYETGGTAGSGGTGTVYLKDSTMTHGVLIVDNPKEQTLRNIQPRTGVTSEGDWTFDEVRIGAWSQLLILADKTLHLPNGLASVTALSNATTSATSIFLTGGTIDMGATADQTMDGTWQLSVVTNLVFPGNLTLTGGAMLGKYNHALNLGNHLDVWSNATYLCSISVAGNLTVDSASSLSASLNGFMQNSAYYFPGYGTSSHGGCYVDTATLTGGAMAYGSILNPLLPARAQSNSYYQPGGGALKLTVGGTLALAGKIVSDGYSGGNAGVRGAGGSINITAGSLTGTGSIHANGLTAESGGRVAVRLTNSDATFDDFTGTITASRDGEAKTAPGTVYLQTAANGEGGGTIIVDGSLRSGTASTIATPYTPIPANGAHADAPDDLRKCALEVSNYARVGIAETLKLASVEMDASSTIDLCGKKLAVTNAKLGGATVTPGTYTPADAVVADFISDTVGGGSFVVMGNQTLILLR